MKVLTKSLAVALLCATAVQVDAAQVTAMPSIGPAIAGAAQISSTVERVQYRDGGGYRLGSGYRRGGNGSNIALGIGAAIIGGIMLSEAARAEHRSSHGDDWSRCAQTYRSFESDTGMYTGYDGVRRTCPYLR